MARAYQCDKCHSFVEYETAKKYGRIVKVQEIMEPFERDESSLYAVHLCGGCAERLNQFLRENV